MVQETVADGAVGVSIGIVNGNVVVYKGSAQPAGVTDTWLQTHRQEALRKFELADLTDLDIDVPIEEALEDFARHPSLFERSRRESEGVRSTLNYLRDLTSRTEGQGDDGADILREASALGEHVVHSVRHLEDQSFGPLPFTERIASARAIIARVEAARTRFHATKDHAADADARDLYRRRASALRSLIYTLQALAESLEAKHRMASASLMIVEGEAGSGKTHLLSQFCRRLDRLDWPVLILFGHLFSTHENPWDQAVAQLRSPNGSTSNDLLALLEVMGKRSDRRPLLVIDALNESRDPTLWSRGLDAFIAHARNCAEVGIILSIRSSYIEGLVPVQVRERSQRVEHRGFRDLPTSAVVRFMRHHGVLFPAAPLFSPEYRNPLMLKTLCRGLQGVEHGGRTPHHLGPSDIFDAWFRKLNLELSASDRLDYNPREGNRVRSALLAMARVTHKRGQRSLLAAEARQCIDEAAGVTGREESRSMYRALIREHVIRDDPTQTPDEYQARIAFDRLADILEAEIVLERLDVPSMSSAEANAEDFTRLARSASPGVLRELSTLMPDRLGVELIDVVPGGVRDDVLSWAFEASLIWRKPSTHTEAGERYWQRLLHDEPGAAFELMLTVAVVPDHPLNAHRLHRVLMGMDMPDRDAVWSTSIFRSWEQEGAVFDLVEWAHSAEMPSPAIVELFATALGWCLTTSHRVLRDRATVALVAMLTGDLDATVRFVERFSNVDDPYILERTYAAAYGVATRSQNQLDGIERLARTTYALIFEGSPPPHILLRYYAQQVIELAYRLGFATGLDMNRVRPPYDASWPAMPSAEDVAPYMPNWSTGSFDSLDPAWSRNVIGSSVLTGDFASYVLFTRYGSNSTSRYWLDRQLDEPLWDPEVRIRDVVQALVDDLGESVEETWARCQRVIDRELSRPRPSPVDLLLRQIGYPRGWSADQWPPDDEVLEAFESESTQVSHSSDEHDWVDAIVAELRGSTSRPEIEDVCRLVRLMADRRERVERPGLPLAQQQRYILYRVFDLGWTLERFGEFDRFTAHRSGRDAGKPERIGKKYQWIAWHELQALMADNFQFTERYSKASATAYQGPWQTFARDIDPTCTLRALPNWEKDAARTSWWKASDCPTVHSVSPHEAWIHETSGLPVFADLLQVQAPEGTPWLNLDASFHWSGGRPPHLDYDEAPQRELWIGITAFLIRRRDVPAFRDWAKGVDFWNRWMPEPGDNTDVLLGEFGWARSWEATRWRSETGDAWIRPERECPVDLLVAGERYLRESGSGSSYDCATDESYTLHLPCGELQRGARLTWAGARGDFLDRFGELATQDPAAHQAGPGSLLVRRDAVEPYLDREGLTICWTILGEKRAVGGPEQAAGRHLPRLRISGFGYFEGHAARGWVKYLDDQHGGDDLPVVDTASW